MSTLVKMAVALALGASLALSGAGADEIIRINPDIAKPEIGRLVPTGSLGCKADRSVDFTDTLIVSNIGGERLRRGTGIRWKASHPNKTVFAQGEAALPRRLDPGETVALRVLPGQVPAHFACTARAMN